MKKHLLLLPLCLLAACRSNTFAKQSTIESVRVLAVQASQPYADPDASVTLTPLAFDGRSDASVPMTFYWVPGPPCINPANGAYYGCYGSLLPGARRGDDVTDRLYVNDAGATDGNWSMGITIPANILSMHTHTATGFSFGTAYDFFIACAGRVKFTPPDPNGSPNANPLTCVDATNGNPVSPDDFVFGYSQVFSFAPVMFDGGTIAITNANPEITDVSWKGVPVPEDGGITVQQGGSGAIYTDVPASSWELDQDNIKDDGTIGHEEIWVDYYMTHGSIDHDAVILYDPDHGPATNAANKYAADGLGRDALLWAVVHDDRGGVAWTRVPIMVTGN